MTVASIVTVLDNVKQDMVTHKDLYVRFQTEVSDSPISGSRETEIVAEYLALAEDIESLYMEVVRSCADWLSQQP